MMRNMDHKTEKRLHRLMQTAYDETPYFNNVINELIDDTDEIGVQLFHKLPVFSKQTIRNIGWPNFISTNYLDEKFEPNYLKGARSERTSGTTGIPMQIIWDENDYFSSVMNHWKFRSKTYGITPQSKMCTSLKNLPGDKLFQIQNNKLTISIKRLNYDTVPQIIEAINQFSPEWLYMQNSILYVLVYVAKKLGLSFPASIRYIEYIGEPICQFYRKQISQLVPVASSNMYGCVETNGISYECSCGKNHILTDNVFVEIVNPQGVPNKDNTTGFVCVTGLHNTAMPMIRYRLNDLATINHGMDCPCGNPAPVIDIQAARMPEFLVLDDTQTYSKACLYAPINSGMKLADVKPNDILFNFKMNSLDDYVISVYQPPKTDISIEKTLQELFFAYGLPKIRFSISNAEVMDPSKSVGLLRMR